MPKKRPPVAVMPPTLPPLPEEMLVRGDVRPYFGEIEPGAVFAWEPDIPHARQLCVVVKVDPAPGATEPRVWTKTFPDDGEAAVFNDLSRFREAVIATRYPAVKL